MNIIVQQGHKTRHGHKIIFQRANTFWVNEKRKVDRLRQRHKTHFSIRKTYNSYLLTMSWCFLKEVHCDNFVWYLSLFRTFKFGLLMHAIYRRLLVLISPFETFNSVFFSHNDFLYNVSNKLYFQDWLEVKMWIEIVKVLVWSRARMSPDVGKGLPCSGWEYLLSTLNVPPYCRPLCSNLSASQLGRPCWVP